MSHTQSYLSCKTLPKTLTTKKCPFGAPFSWVGRAGVPCAEALSLLQRPLGLNCDTISVSPTVDFILYTCIATVVYWALSSSKIPVTYAQCYAWMHPMQTQTGAEAASAAALLMCYSHYALRTLEWFKCYLLCFFIFLFMYFIFSRGQWLRHRH